MSQWHKRSHNFMPCKSFPPKFRCFIQGEDAEQMQLSPFSFLAKSALKREKVILF